MNKTSIEWTDYSSNLIKYRDPDGKVVYGCVKVSPGCANCYASAISKRFSGGEFTASRQKTLTPFFDEEEARRILRSRATGKKVFVGDMTDVLGEWVPDEMLDRMFAVFALRPDLTFQVLTKRPERMRAYLANPHTSAVAAGMRWPLPNVWLGVSVEDQAAADERIPALLDTPAAVRFLSCEPLLERVDLEPWLRRVATSGPGWRMTGGSAMAIADIVLDWVIVGGESGPGARPCNFAWIRDIVAQCKAAGVPAFVKQLGANPEATIPGSWINELQSSGPPIDIIWRLRDRKGGDMSEWPEDLRMRQYPDV